MGAPTYQYDTSKGTRDALVDWERMDYGAIRSGMWYDSTSTDMSKNGLYRTIGSSRNYVIVTILKSALGGGYDVGREVAVRGERYEVIVAGGTPAISRIYLGIGYNSTIQYVLEMGVSKWSMKGAASGDFLTRYTRVHNVYSNGRDWGD